MGLPFIGEYFAPWGSEVAAKASKDWALLGYVFSKTRPSESKHMLHKTLAHLRHVDAACRDPCQ